MPQRRVVGAQVGVDRGHVGLVQEEVLLVRRRLPCLQLPPREFRPGRRVVGQVQRRAGKGRGIRPVAPRLRCRRLGQVLVCRPGAGGVLPTQTNRLLIGRSDVVILDERKFRPPLGRHRQHAGLCLDHIGRIGPLEERPLTGVVLHETGPVAGVVDIGRRARVGQGRPFARLDRRVEDRRDVAPRQVLVLRDDHPPLGDQVLRQRRPGNAEKCRRDDGL